MERPFVAATSGGDVKLFNLDLVRMVDRIGPGRIRLIFSEAHSVELNGDGAALMLQRIAERSVDIMNGDALSVGQINLASPDQPE